MNDIMVDLETMDNTASAAIVSIGAIQCDILTGETGGEFYRVIELKGQDKLNMTINASTLYWWLNQSEVARSAITQTNKISLNKMCILFNKWLEFLDPSTEKLRLWGNGASFDNAIIRYAYRQCDLEFSIPFWQDRDMRTLMGFYPQTLQAQWKANNRRAGAHHNALDDARYQIKFCSNIMQELGVKEIC